LAIIRAKIFNICANYTATVDSHLSEVVSMLPPMAKALLRRFGHFLPLMAKQTLPDGKIITLEIPTAFIKFGQINKLHSGFG